MFGLYDGYPIAMSQPVFVMGALIKLSGPMFGVSNGYSFESCWPMFRMSDGCPIELH